MDKKAEELRRYAAMARRAGFAIKKSKNAGGWVSVASACGMKDGGKGAARLFLVHKFGAITIEPQKQRPAAPAIARDRPRLKVIQKPANSVPFESTDAFLGSYEWRRVRMKVLEKIGNRCQCCGATPADGIRINVDHIKPRKTHPHLALDESNLQVLCNECNHGKGNWSTRDWRGIA